MKLEFECDVCHKDYVVEGEERSGLPFLVDCRCGGMLSLRYIDQPIEIFGADY